MEHETVRWVRQCEETLSGGISPDDLRVKQEEDRIIGDNGHFCAIVTRLVKHPFAKLHEYVQILFGSGVKGPVVVLRLWSWVVDLPYSFPPFLL